MPRHIANSASHDRPSRRDFLKSALRASAAFVALPLTGAALSAQPRAKLPTMLVYKDPNCGCCKEWVKHMQKAGFTVTAKDTTSMDAIKVSTGVPAGLTSCHTAIIAGYFIEGHAPADVVQRLLREKPVALGLAVPGMPQGSPGMETGTKDKYDVLLVEKGGKTRVYASR